MSSQKNVVQVLVSDLNAQSNAANVAALPNGELGFFKKDNTAGIAGDEGRYVLRIDANNIIESSYIKKFVAWTLGAYVPAVAHVETVTITTVEVGTVYILDVEQKIKGQTGVFVQKGIYKAITGDTVTTIATALTKSLNASLAREGNTVITATSALGVITITGVAQDYVPHKKDGRFVRFNTGLVSGPAVDVKAGTVTVAGTNGVGLGKFVHARELFAFGNQDPYRYNGWRNNFEPKALSSASKNYKTQVINELSEIETANGHVLANVDILLAFNTAGAAPAV
jgi:hypothetical protein